MKKISYRKILVTHDGSDLSLEAIPHALSLAKAYQSEVLLLHAVYSVKALTSMVGTADFFPPVIPLEDIAKTVALLKKSARNALDNIKTDFEKNGVSKITSYIEEGDAANIISDVAKVEKCDLIVMATHGRSGLRRAMLGSVADYVVRHAQCPVLLVRAKEK